MSVVALNSEWHRKPKNAIRNILRSGLCVQIARKVMMKVK